MNLTYGNQIATEEDLILYRSKRFKTSEKKGEESSELLDQKGIGGERLRIPTG